MLHVSCCTFALLLENCREETFWRKFRHRGTSAQNHPFGNHPSAKPRYKRLRNSTANCYQSRFVVEGDATKHFSVKKGLFSEKGGGNSVNEGFGKDFYRKGNSVKRSGPFSEPPDSEN